jgi:hypothetical protein
MDGGCLNDNAKVIILKEKMWTQPDTVLSLVLWN